MTYRLLKNIEHTTEYNPGGIAEILLLDFKSFSSYKFIDDRLYDSCSVDKINLRADTTENKKTISLDSVGESTFTEQESNGIFTQNLSTFVRSLDYQKTERLLKAKLAKLLVMFRTNQDKWFTFGSDCGASLTFEQTTGQLGASNGYKISLSANSIYPLFQLSNTPDWEEEVEKPEPKPEDIEPDPYVKGRVGQLIFEANLIQQNDYASSFVTPVDYRLEKFPSDEELPSKIEPLDPMPLETQEIDEFWVTSPLYMYVKNTDYLYTNGANRDFVKHLGLDKSDFIGLTEDVSEYELLKAYGNQMYRREGVDYWYLSNAWGKKKLVWSGLDKPALPKAKEVVLVERTELENLPHVFKKSDNGYSNAIYWRNGGGDYSHMFNKRIKYIDIYVETPYTDKPMFITVYGPGYYYEQRKYTFGETAGWNRVYINQEMTEAAGGGTNLTINISDGAIRVNKINGTSKIGQWMYPNSWQYVSYASWDLGIGITVEEDYYPYRNLWEEETQRWRIPLREEMFQLLGQAPVTSGNMGERLSDFICASEKENKYKVKSKYFGGFKNTSGFGAFPLGWRGGGATDSQFGFGFVTTLFCGWIEPFGLNGSGHNKTQPLDRLHLFHSQVGSFEKGISINPHQYETTHSGNVHLLKKKKDSELKYILRINEQADKVEFTSTEGMLDNWVKPQTGYHYNNSGERVNNLSPTSTTIWEAFHAEYYIEKPDDSYKYLEFSMMVEAGRSTIWLFDEDMVPVGNIPLDYPHMTIIKKVVDISQFEGVKYIYINSKYPYEVNGFNIRLWKNKPSELPELTPGLERGIALRYSNRKHKKVLREWSLIKSEAEEMRSQIKIL